VAARVHLIAPAGTCEVLLPLINVSEPADLVAIAQEAMGPDFEVTADVGLLASREDDQHGGRDDDEQRAADIQHALADDDVCALVALRGGAWLTRIIPRIDFSVLDQRTQPVVVWGFSELTTLVNIVGAHPRGLGVYGMVPAFFRYALTRIARQRGIPAGSPANDPETWVATRLRPEFDGFFHALATTLAGGAEPVAFDARVVRGRADQCTGPAVFVGGNLTVLSTLIGSRYDACIQPDDRWLVLEDYNDKPERFDRLFAHLTLAGYFDRCRGVLLGDFHLRDRDLLEVVLAILDYHLPRDRAVPVLATEQVGHVWPMVPLPLHIGAAMSCDASGRCRIAFPQDTLTLFHSR